MEIVQTYASFNAQLGGVPTGQNLLVRARFSHLDCPSKSCRSTTFPLFLHQFHSYSSPYPPRPSYLCSHRLYLALIPGSAKDVVNICSFLCTAKHHPTLRWSAVLIFFVTTVNAPLFCFLHHNFFIVMPIQGLECVRGSLKPPYHRSKERLVRMHFFGKPLRTFCRLNWALPIVHTPQLLIRSLYLERTFLIIGYC